ncbi:MAG: MotA/TolQ/ExbB proton channel family protein [Deltaproteobacteria bacterium]|nr:MAG: MotA/TolQ/ExbB proton channel family protein [Deltaproteobacteria bacterium]
MLNMIIKFFHDGGVFMYPITVILAFVVAVVVERIYFLSFKSNLDAAKLFSEIRKYVKDGDVEAAAKLLNDSPLCRVLKAGLTNADRDIDMVRSAMEEEAVAVIPRIEKRITHLSTAANVATLLGLLGTIYGLIAAFSAVAEADPAQKATLLAKGISIAMNTTAYGLIVAIPTIIAHSFLQSRANRLLDEIDEYSLKLLNLFKEVKKEKQVLTWQE